jgi:hypothetical protein
LTYSQKLQLHQFSLKSSKLVNSWLRGTVDVVCWKKRSNYLVDLHPQEQQLFEKQGSIGTGTVLGLLVPSKSGTCTPPPPVLGDDRCCHGCFSSSDAAIPAASHLLR